MKKTFLLLLLVGGISLFASARGGYPFEVKISGQGAQSIIFIPGLTCSSEVWNETIARYNKDYTCYALTFHGFAGVPADDSASFSNWEHEIARYITEKKITKPVIIGHSIGGGMAMLLAADYPQLISKIVIVDALPSLTALQNPNFISNPHPDCSPFIQRFESLSDDQFFQMQQQTMASLISDTLHLKQVLQWSLDSDRKTLAKIYCQFLNLDMRDTLSAIQCPSLVLLEHTFTGMKTAIAEQYKQLKNVQLEYANKGLHFIMYDDPEWYFSQLDQFLKKS